MVVDAPARFPLFERFPALGSIPRAHLCTLPSPVQRLPESVGKGEIWIKRDDLNAPICGGNKARALEFLLGGLASGDAVITVGGEGSTHVLSTALHAARLGIGCSAFRWRHDMNPVAELVSGRIMSLTPDNRVRRSALAAMVRARFGAFRDNLRFVPIGGSSPLGILGHVNAALELSEQIRRDDAPLPESVVLPVGSGGTAAGLMLGFAVAGLPVRVVGARVGPAPLVNRMRVMHLVKSTAALIERVAGERLPSVGAASLQIVHDVYGGAYGRPLARGSNAANILHEATGIRVDDTYSAKAWAGALDVAKVAKGPTFFWLTFDAKCLTN